LTKPQHAYYASTVQKFLAAKPDSIVKELAFGGMSGYRGSEGSQNQKEAWIEELSLLRKALSRIPKAGRWGLLLEYSLHRLNYRPDALLLAPGVIVVIEFKMGARRYDGRDIDQVVGYALSVRDFYNYSRGYVIVPVICAERAPARQSARPIIIEDVAQVICSNSANLSRDLRMAASLGNSLRGLAWQAVDQGVYNPTPSIVEAARALYAGHTVKEIHRTDSNGARLRKTQKRLRYWVSMARQKKRRVICLVTGAPGAGKSLLGLELILTQEGGYVEGEPAAWLTGNPPLVHVLKEALLRDATNRGGDPNAAKHALRGALQALLGYLKQHKDPASGAPPERVLVFDEAQRVWDAPTGKRLKARELRA
jgi:Schlafen group 3, DNA/RNA helicase domain